MRHKPSAWKWNDVCLVEKVFSISIKGKVPHLWHRQVVTLQSQLTAIPLRESERFPKGNYITVELHKLREQFWFIMHRSTVVSLGSCEHTKELGPREQASGKKVLHGNHYRLERATWRSSDIWHIKGLWGQQWPWWRWCHLGCRSSWCLVWREGRREGSRWQCSCHSQASGRRKRKCLAGRHRWCAPCCSGPVTWGWPKDQDVG